MKCPDEPVHAIEGEERFPVNILCSYPGCTHFKMINHPNCYCHRNSSLPGGGPEVSKS